jgi:hypothetical protein
MGFEIPVDVDYFEHPKTQMLIAILGRRYAEADIYPLRLWRWCALYARDGIITTPHCTCVAESWQDGGTTVAQKCHAPATDVPNSRHAACRLCVTQIETACRWSGKPGRLHAALCQAGFIENDGKTLRNWMFRTGRAIALYEAKKSRQREKYAAEVGILPEENGRIPPILLNPTLDGIEKTTKKPKETETRRRIREEREAREKNK